MTNKKEKSKRNVMFQIFSPSFPLVSVSQSIFYWLPGSLVQMPGSRESIPPGWESIPELLKRFTNTGSERIFTSQAGILNAGKTLQGHLVIITESQNH
jgi:hypothetical protein